MNARRIHNRVGGGLVVLMLCAVPAWADIPPGVRACWEFDEGNGTTAYDTSGNGFDGTLYADPAWVPGIQGQALEFLDHDMVWQIPAAFDDTVSGSQAFTIAAWVQWDGPNSLGKRSDIFDGRGNPYAQRGFDFNIRTDHKLSLWLTNQPGAEVVSVSDIPSNDAFTHVVAEFDGAAQVMRAFINGQLDNTVSTAGVYYNSYDLAAIGNNHWAPGDSQWATFNGVLDEVYFYDRALSGAEVYELYLATPEPASLVLLGLGVATMSLRRR